MKQNYAPDFDDVEACIEDEVSVETFLRKVERHDRKMRRLAAQRKTERRLDRRVMSGSGRGGYDD